MKETPPGYVSIRAAEDRTGKHHTTLRRWWRQGAMPPPRRLGPNSIAFLESEFEAWLKSRPAVGQPRDADIRVDNRHRRDLGDVEEPAASIEETPRDDADSTTSSATDDGGLSIPPFLRRAP